MSEESSNEAPSGESESTNNESPEEKPAEPKNLTAEEQMALYEESLKDDDWGHQPC